MRGLFAYRIPLCSILLLFCVFLAAISSTQYFLTGMTSDWLYVFEPVLTIIKNKTIYGQDFPGSPYYFPDYLVVAFIAMFTKNITLMYFFYGLTFLAAYIYFVKNLFYSITLRNDLALFSTLCNFTVLFFLLVLSNLSQGDTWYLIIWPGSHLSVILYALFFINMYITKKSEAYSWPLIISLFIFMYLMFISDSLLFVQVIVPMAVVVLYDFCRGKHSIRSTLSLLYIFLIVVFLGKETPYWLMQHFGVSFVMMDMNLFHFPTPSELAEYFTRAGSAIAMAYEKGPALYLTLIFFNVFGLCYVLYCLKKRKMNGQPNIGTGRLLTVLLFLYLSQICNLLLVIGSGKISVSAHLRYLDTFFYFPPLIFILCLGSMLKNNVLFKSTLCVMLFLIFSGIGLFIKNCHHQFAHLDFSMPYNPTIQCIDNAAKKYHLQNGAADYWHSRTNRMFTKENVRIVSITHTLENKDLYFFIGSENKSLFYKDVHKKTPFHYQFLIMNLLNEDYVSRVIGQPDNIVVCRNATLWLYLSKPKQQKLNNYFDKVSYSRL